MTARLEAVPGLFFVLVRPGRSLRCILVGPWPEVTETGFEKVSILVETGAEWRVPVRSLSPYIREARLGPRVLCCSDPGPSTLNRSPADRLEAGRRQ